MVKLATLVTIEALPGKEAEVEAFLLARLTEAEEEPGTVGWYAMKLSPAIFGIFGTFATREGQLAHMEGTVARELIAAAPYLFIDTPHVQHLDLLAAKQTDV
jgi:quinol monooxygenase YgiN